MILSDKCENDCENQSIFPRVKFSPSTKLMDWTVPDKLSINARKTLQ